MSNGEQENKVKKLKKAFEKDDFSFDAEDDVFRYEGKIGVRAHSKTAVNYQTKVPKKAYYVEGSPEQMGYLMGLMAEKDIAEMSVKYVEYFPFAFLGLKVSPGLIEKIIHRILNLVFKHWIKKIKKDIPDIYKEEMKGMLAGCKAAAEAEGGHTRVREDDLWTLNVGIDAIFAHFFTGKILGFQKILSKRVKIPVFCNAFSVFGDAAKDNGHFFGRDFMFEDAGVFQQVACLVIYNPDDRTYLPFVSQTAPGIIGSLTGVNTHGVTVGVDVSPSGACNAWRPGFNSLLLVRHCIHLGKNADEVVEVIADARRGVSWIYPVADPDRAGIVEALCKLDKTEDEMIKYLLSFPPKKYKKHLPDKDFIKENLQKYSEKERELLCKGLMVRWSDYRCPENYLEFNEGLWAAYNEDVWHLHKVKYPDDGFGERGYINKYYTVENNPSAFYFAPQREKRDDLVIAANHFIIPELRLPAMHSWTTLVTGSRLNDFQWRYDALNDLILAHLYPNGESETGDQTVTPVSYETARRLIDFLSPKETFFPCYYDQENRSEDCKEIAISGSTSILNLKEKSIESHFGYFGDKWVKITLPNYVE